MNRYCLHPPATSSPLTNPYHPTNEHGQFSWSISNILSTVCVAVVGHIWCVLLRFKWARGGFYILVNQNFIHKTKFIISEYRVWMYYQWGRIIIVDMLMLFFAFLSYVENDRIAKTTSAMIIRLHWWYIHTLYKYLLDFIKFFGFLISSKLNLSVFCRGFIVLCLPVLPNSRNGRHFANRPCTVVQ